MAMTSIMCKETNSPKKRNEITAVNTANYLTGELIEKAGLRLIKKKEFPQAGLFKIRDSEINNRLT